MTFSEKLTFLMKITSASSKGLAEFLHVDPSRISQLKTGRRGRPRDPETLTAIAAFYARRCTSTSQRIALSEGIGNIAFSNHMTTEEFTNIIFHWLEDSPIAPSHSEMDELTASSSRPLNSIANTSNDGQYIFYGNEGKRNAVRLMYQQALDLEEPQTIYMCTEENPTWYYEDPAFLAEQEAQRLKLVQKGCRIIHILDLNTSLDVTFENVIRWIPAYMTGNVEPYYYPRIRDGVFNHTLMIIPGKMSLFSTSIANNPISRMTLVSTNPHMLEETSSFLLDYLNICIPALNIYWTHEDAMQCIDSLSLYKANRIQKRLSLPPNTLPTSILEEYASNQQDLFRSSYASFFIDNVTRIKSDLEKYENIEISPLATANEVRLGKVRIEFPSSDKGTMEFYTPQTYALHLRNIVEMLEAYSKFHFVPIPYDENGYISILIKQSKKAVLQNTQDGVITLDTEQSDLVKIFHEYLLRFIDHIDFRSAKGRQRIISHLKSLIAELEQ